MFMKDAVHMKCTHELAFHSINLLKSENKQKMVWVNAWHLADGDGDIGTNCFESSEKINKIKGVKMFDWSTCQTSFEVVKRHISGGCFHWEVVGLWVFTCFVVWLISSQVSPIGCLQWRLLRKICLFSIY